MCQNKNGRGLGEAAAERRRAFERMGALGGAVGLTGGETGGWTQFSMVDALQCLRPCAN